MPTTSRFRSWPASTILALLDQAAVEGEARAETTSPEAAERLRFAIYNYRRRYLDASDSRRDLTITIDGSVITLAQPAIPTVNILKAD